MKMMTHPLPHCHEPLLMGQGQWDNKDEDNGDRHNNRMGDHTTTTTQWPPQLPHQTRDTTGTRMRRTGTEWWRWGQGGQGQGWGQWRWWWWRGQGWGWNDNNNNNDERDRDGDGGGMMMMTMRGMGWGWGWNDNNNEGDKDGDGDDNDNDNGDGEGGFFLFLSSKFCILVVCKTYPRCLITYWKVFYKWMKIYLKNGRNSTSQNVLKSLLKVN